MTVSQTTKKTSFYLYYEQVISNEEFLLLGRVRETERWIKAWRQIHGQGQQFKFKIHGYLSYECRWTNRVNLQHI
jgi:hypothetical protein